MTTPVIHALMKVGVVVRQNRVVSTTHTPRPAVTRARFLFMKLRFLFSIARPLRRPFPL